MGGYEDRTGVAFIARIENDETRTTADADADSETARKHVEHQEARGR